MSVINVAICAGTAIGEYAVVVAFLLYRKLLRNSYKAKKPSGGCALAREEIVAIATALGASVLRAERFLVQTY